MRTFSLPLSVLWTGLAVLVAPTLLGARGCAPESHCTLEYAPVCGVDGVTYGNTCEADRADVDIAYPGECGVACYEIYAPVCGVDGVTYPNDCYADAAGVEIAHPGECGVACYEIYAPVCGADGVTYPNDCYAHAAGVEIVREGACECDAIACPAFIYCEYGMARDASGCETCECAPPPVCEPVLCDLYCEYGFATDPSTGCETCRCNDAPTNCASDSDCGDFEMCLVAPCLPVCEDEDGDGACDEDFCGVGVCVPREMEHPCSSDAECGVGAYCEIEGCTTDCTGSPDEDCGRPSACYGRCRALPPPPPPAECISDADCAEGWCDVSECLPVGDLTVCGGLCRGSEPPPSHCDADADCGVGARCEPIACAAVCEPAPDGSESCFWDCPGGICVVDGGEPDHPEPHGI